jgi:glycosyltransferase involved in cell wall biosynthesis
MKLGFSFMDLAPGGAQQLLVQLALELTHLGHKINFAINTHLDDPHHVDPDLLRLLLQTGTPVSNPWDLRACQVVHLDGYHNLRHKIPFLVSWGKCVETYHSKYSVRRSGPLYAPHRVAVSKYIQAYLPAPTNIIPNGIKIPVPHETASKEYDIAILGRIHPVKRQDFFLKICQQLFLQRKKLTCLLIGGYSGDRHYQEEIENQIANLQSQQVQINITGFIPHEQVFSWLVKTRILIIPSNDEGFGRMAIEAMACGLPIISNPVGGLREIIDHGIDGYFAEQNQLDSFVQLADYLLNNPSLCQHMGAQGKNKVKSRYTLEKITSAYVDLYQRVAMETT